MYNSMALPTEASWGDTLKSYQRERTEASWDKIGQSMPAKDHRVTHYEKRPMFDPVLSRHMNPAVERVTREAESQRTTSKIEAAQSKMGAFNIVTNKHRTDSALDRPAAHASNRPPDSRTSWNIINHHRTKPSEGHTRGLEDGPMPASWARREFDIVSNKYGSDHDGRSTRDRTEAKQKAQRRFWETHDYDPVVGKYHDPSKEREFAKQRGELAQCAGDGRAARLPPAVRYCEGSAYDIVSNVVRDAEKLEIAKGVGNRSLNSKKGPSVERALRERVQARDELQKERALTRFSRTAEQREREEGRHHGYDVLSHLSHHGRDAAPEAPPRLRRQQPAFDRLEQTGATCSRAYGANSRSAHTSERAAVRDLSGAAASSRASECASAPTRQPNDFSARASSGSAWPRQSNVPIKNSTQGSSRPPVPALKIPTARDD